MPNDIELRRKIDHQIELALVGDMEVMLRNTITADDKINECRKPAGNARGSFRNDCTDVGNRK